MNVGWASYAAEWPGPLGQDGAVVVVGRPHGLRGRCPVCGRRGRLWQAALALPQPFPGALDAIVGGCSRDHAVRALPADWSDVAAVFTRLTDALRADDEPTFWHEKLATRRARQAEQARLLSRLDPTARRLALELLRSDELLDVAQIEAVASAVLAEPPGQHIGGQPGPGAPS
ncbi:hypothetical protein [Blastococcus sp. PRF04-17]|uniref:hypothetical protein n=1 Tax=Blastococcus sp. PRF04-17 TaxID=2933797 RepID=UPI001FF37F0D|nr:hypothetical protein [Blastococcus sp. PRF04-17]UOY03707.1 hypothetical protein MVA48_10410 [Blastococcus sp. PRF04-17]